MPAPATRHRLAATVLLGIAFLAACQTARSPDAQRGAASRDDPRERRYTEHAVPRGPHHIYARDYPGEGPALVLMHGFPYNSRLYDVSSPSSPLAE
jgi:hypothetical protein